MMSGATRRPRKAPPHAPAAAPQSANPEVKPTEMTPAPKAARSRKRRPRFVL